MTEQELAKYAGSRIYALCCRTDNGHEDVNHLTVYQITERGELSYVYEILSCVANERQYKYMMRVTGGHYVVGRPTAEKISINEIKDLVIL